MNLAERAAHKIEQRNRLAELVAQEISIPNAARRMRVTSGYAYALWAEIKAGLGAQAA